MLLRLQCCVAAKHRSQEPTRATDTDQKQSDAESEGNRSFIGFTRMRGVAERYVPTSAEKGCNDSRRNERQGDVPAAAGEGFGGDAQADREGRRARGREGRNTGKGQMGS